MQAVDAQGRQTHAIVLDDAYQLSQGGGAVAGAADGRSERGHQVIKRIAQLLPALMDIEKSLDLQHGTDATVPGALVFTLEQPAVDFLAFEMTGGHGVLELRIRVLQQIAHQPQIQWVNPCNVALVWQVPGARAVSAIHVFQAFVGEFGADLVLVMWARTKALKVA